MKKITNITNDIERAFYNSNDCYFDKINIDGPADGESAFKECSNIEVDNSFFNLRISCASISIGSRLTTLRPNPSKP